MVSVGSEDLTLIGKGAKKSHGPQLIQAGTVICEPDGTPLIIFGKLEPRKHSALELQLPHIKYSENSRLTQKNNDYAQKRSSYINFGYKPKRPVFGHAASTCVFNSKNLSAYQNLIQLGLDLEVSYKRCGPDIYDRQKAEVESLVEEEWRIPGTVFTQGIINNSNALDFHLDRGNFKDFWSCMAVFSKDTLGGELVVPSLGIRLAIKNRTYVLFNGQKHVHGVTEIIKTTPQAYRYSVVYYALEAMRNCGSYEEEVNAARAFDIAKHRKNRHK